MLADTFDTDDTFDQFPISNYKWSDFYKKYFSGEDDIKEHNQLRELKNQRNNINFTLVKCLTKLIFAKIFLILI